VKDIFPAINNDSMTGIMPALIASNYIEVCRKQINDFAFSLVTPLGTDNN